MKMPKQITTKLTEIRNNASHVFCFFQSNEVDEVAYYSSEQGAIEDTIFEVLTNYPELLEMFEAVVEEARDYLTEQN